MTAGLESTERDQSVPGRQGVGVRQPGTVTGAAGGGAGRNLRLWRMTRARVRLEYRRAAATIPSAAGSALTLS